jgi:SNF2 family DNA or RNA helicase
VPSAERDVTAGVFGEISGDGAHVVVIASGDDHEVKQAATAMRKMTPLFEGSKPPGALIGPLTWATVCQLGHTFSGNTLGRWVPGPRLTEWITAELLRRAGAGQEEREPLKLPEGLEPRPYQDEAARMIGTGGKFLLFDDPGTGKTVSALLGLLERQARGHEIFPMVVVVPSWDVGDVWARHAQAWAPAWPQPVMYGGKDRRLGWGGLAITTYATARLDAADVKGPLARLKAKSVIADEVHYAKNQSSLQSQALRRISQHAGTFLGLSGTPITRDTGDIHPTLSAMDPLSWPDRKRMVKRYCMTTDGEYEDKIEGLNPMMEPEFRAVLMGQYRRVAKADVLDQLPPKVYSVRRVEMPPEWRKAYDGMAAQMLADLPDGEELEVMSVLAQLTRLSQLASSACDVKVTVDYDPETGEEKKHYEVTLKAPSWKVDALLEVLSERKGRQVVVFSVSRQLADIAGAACQEAGYRCGYITGSQSKSARKDDIDAFQAGKLDVMIATAGAGSLGITLTAAGTAVFLQRSWQLDQAIQAEDRLHRIGQENDCVEIIDIIALATVDDRVRELLRIKGGQLSQLIRDPRIARELLGGLR